MGDKAQKRLRAVIYARYSSHNQDEISIEDQIAVDSRFIEDQGWDLVGIYSDSAQTGTNDKRDDYKRLMDDAAKDVYNVVVIWHTNRIHRNMINAFAALSELFKHGKDFRSATQRELNDPDSDTRLIMFAIHAWKDEGDSKNISRDVRRGQQEKAMKCHPLGQRRYGWDIAGAHIDGTGKYHAGDHYEINEQEAEAVRIAYRMRAQGHSFEAIAKKLNGRGYTNKRSRPMDGGTVSHMIANDAYKGVYRYGDIRIEGGIPRIISDEEWEAAQSPKVRTFKHRKHVYVKLGMVFGSLRVTKQADSSAYHHTKWLCECLACGGAKVEWAQRLTNGKATHCGCLSTDSRMRDALGRFVG